MRHDTNSEAAEGEAASVRTFLIADLRGYTRYSDEHGDEAASTLARSFAVIASEAVGARGGEVIELRGDEALCVFASARSAVRGAVELQRRARDRVDGEPALPLGVGIGLDAGEAVPTAGGYRGRALNVAARLCSLAEGGEILATETVAHLAGRHDDVQYAPRRPTTVKGVGEPIRFVEVVPKLALPPSPSLHHSTRSRRARRRGALLLAAGLALAVGIAIAAVQLSDRGDSNVRFGTIASAQCGPLHYEGASSPQLLIASSLPLQPGALATTTSMIDAMTLALERRDYKAGAYRIGLQVCDEAAPGSEPFFDEASCLANARDYVRTSSVIGVVGPFVSPCATLLIPILNEAPGGPVAIVSPSNTYVGLTRRPSSTNSDEPDGYYPTGQRNYARVLPADDVQAAADAIVARRLGVKRVYAVDDDGGAGEAFVNDFLRAARRLGLEVAGREPWDPCCYKALATGIAQSGADGVFLGVPSGPQSVRLLTELRARLGGATQFMAPDGFDPDAAVLAGAAAEGMTISQPGPANDHLRSEGRQFVAAYSKKFGAEPTRYAVNAAQAIDVLLEAIARSDGTRGSVTTNLFRTRISNGILGSFSITLTGDITLNAVAIYRIIGGEVKTFATVLVPDALVAPE